MWEARRVDGWIESHEQNHPHVDKDVILVDQGLASLGCSMGQAGVKGRRILESQSQFIRSGQVPRAPGLLGRTSFLYPSSTSDGVRGEAKQNQWLTSLWMFSRPRRYSGDLPNGALGVVLKHRRPVK